ncbi:MAG: DUF2892 domain-containing protein [Alphaproteobacteria bacterium]|nr:DUF2892 domain-containing protein [Alphaproteobacteria bacterium]
MSDIQTIHPKDLHTVEGKGGVILDVRTPGEHSDAHLARPHAHVPLGELDPADFMLRRGLDRETPVYMLCKAGTRARAAAEKFAAAGFPNVHVIEGGIIACDDCGEDINAMVVETGTAAGSCATKQPMSVERQVRLIAGLVVLVTSALGIWVNPVWLYVPLAVGAGLSFSGVSGFCLMAETLKKMPWNKGLKQQADTGGACGIIKPDNIPASSPGPGKPGCA